MAPGRGSMKTGRIVDSYMRAAGWSAVATALHWSLYVMVGPRVPFLFFLPAVVVAASTLGRGPAWLVLLSGAVNYMLSAPPFGDLAVDNPQDRFALLAYLLLGFPLAAYCARLRLISQRASEAEQRLSLVQREAGIGLFELDYAARTAFVSPSLCRILEQPVSNGPIPLDRWLQMLPQDHVSESNAAVQQRLRDGIHDYDGCCRTSGSRSVPAARWRAHAGRRSISRSASNWNWRSTTARRS